MICTGGGAGGVAVAGMIGMKSPFTMSQMEELENQALIFKYMIAGLPVPLDLMLPIHKSFDHASAHSFFHHPTMGYCSFYRKVDPEPGRCKRTDGKKWRCSKDAYMNSKYCERHMHRGRNRSRKHVESKTLTNSSSPSLTVSGTSSGSGMFRNVPLYTFGNTQGDGSVNNQSHYDVDSIPFGIPTKDYRYLQGLEPEVCNHGITLEASRSSRGLEIESHLDNSNATRTPSQPSETTLVSDNSFLDRNSGFGLSEHAKEEQHYSLRPFLDEWPTMRESWPTMRDSWPTMRDSWPTMRDSWPCFEDQTSNQPSVSTTQLSISIPIDSSSLFSTTSQSLHHN